ncbi:formylglycine-generating enzyme family protein [Blastopirellula sp. JC732]|uniref:Formylglycine-generating enzyme family protein n=1 Tax=Blastopirellula sediminis TaxID=2894196 RepID=A0A9X1SJ09_9BACT|nr:SUMF1/EgtB/PvdO family nonheme iron enzyme [Blastopirellula sediminis]MCC9604859.1 formylglycine-generating enzyme family protein [Blastopirellula sediminis]MCC9631842.1 formylglycine-generating enzyme family protein [Blastopirellula sediminis]
MRIAIAGAILLLTIAAPVAAEETLGIVKEKPTEGFFVEIDGGYMVPYEMQIPGTEVKLAMVPVPGGTHVMGTGDSAYRVKIEPFWMAQTETTWGQYHEFMQLHDLFKKFKRAKVRLVTDENKIDAVTVPTPLRDRICSDALPFDNGDNPQQVAVTMTQYAAMQFSKWLSRLTGQQYRLPSEAEWEHAALGGTVGPYSCGGVDKLQDYAWYVANADEKLHQVGGKLPNQYGLYDMQGNVWEWVLDAYVAAPPAELSGKTLTVAEAIEWPIEPYPLCLKGGSWDDGPEACKVAAKLGSDDEEWKMHDPNIPLSPWWFTNYPANCVGFRVIRPLQRLPNEAMVRYWEPSAAETKRDIIDRVTGQWGEIGLVDEKLPEAMKKAHQE